MKITLKRTSPNYRRSLSTQGIMRDLTLGLLVIALYTVGFQYMRNGSDYGIHAALMYVIAVVVALVVESLYACVRKQKSVKEHLQTTFPFVTPLIFVLTLPVGTPYYVVAIGAFIAVFFGKLVYGGFGMNIFNPALVGRVVVHLSFSSQLVSYLPKAGSDIYTGATPVTLFSQGGWHNISALFEKIPFNEILLGFKSGALCENAVLPIIIIGIILAMRKVFDYRIPLAYLSTVAVLAAVASVMFSQNMLMYVATHLVMGGLVFGSLIMATDPVTSPTSPLGKILFGMGLGFLTMLIRLAANYPEGVLFSILIMNMLTPWIDHIVVGRTNKNMKKQYMMIGLVAVLAIGCIGGITKSQMNQVIADQIAAEEEAKRKEEEAKRKAEEEAAAHNWTLLAINGNTYTMQTKGYGEGGNLMTIDVTVEGDVVKAVQVVEYKGETEYFGADLIEGLKKDGAAGEFYNKVLNSEFAISEIDGIDTSTGCTMTSKGIMMAIKGAVAVSQMEISQEGDLYTYIMSEKGYGEGGNLMKIKVVVDKANQVVKSVEVLEYAGETEYFGADLIQGLKTDGAAGDFYRNYLNAEFAFDAIDGVDTATGCTMTTKGIVTAIRKAIAASK